MASPNDKYMTDDYVDQNPSWDLEDSPWKADHVQQMLSRNRLTPNRICEVGCGAGAILQALKEKRPDVHFTGYDIAPAAKKFWDQIELSGIDFVLGDFFNMDNKEYGVILLLDVLEHVVDPHQFLSGLKSKADYIIIHFPLDLSAFSVVREKPLLHVRRKVGHIHYFTKGLALELLDECGFDVLDCQYTGAAFNTPQAEWKTRLAQLPRRIAYALNKDVGVRLLGGETLMVLAKAR